MTTRAADAELKRDKYYKLCRSTDGKISHFEWWVVMLLSLSYKKVRVIL